MQVVLLLIIGVFLIYRMMRVEERMNKIEYMMNKQNQNPNEDIFWDSIKDKVENDTEYRNTDGWDEELEKQYWENEGKEHMPPELEKQFWAEQPPEPFATPEEVEKYNIDGKK